MSSERPHRPRPASGGRDRAPSPAAQARLSGALRHRADAYRQDASIDLMMFEALLRVDEHEAAARTIDGHRAALLAMARDLQVAVADAAVEREAEAVCDAVQTKPAPPAVGGLRRRILTLAGAAAVVVALVLPQARLSPRTTLASVEGGSSQDDLHSALDRLAAAQSAARAVRAGAPPAAAAAQSSDAGSPATRSSLAADAPGESAAPSLSTVVDLDAYRARRGGNGTAKTPTAATAEEPAIDVPDPRTAVPRAGVPLNTDADLEVDGVPTPQPEQDPLQP